MNKEMMDTLMLWGDRANRDTSHLMDIVVAGAIDQLTGHGRVVLRPARLEEIVSRIGPRERDPDGGWIVTLLPDTNRTATEAMQQDRNTEVTSAEVATMAGRILSAGNPLDNDQVLAVICKALEKGNTPEGLADIKAVMQPYIQNMMSIAGSALTQRG